MALKDIVLLVLLFVLWNYWRDLVKVYLIIEKWCVQFIQRIYSLIDSLQGREFRNNTEKASQRTVSKVL